jgi:uncharacterized protein YheU (UPF0270 family)
MVELNLSSEKEMNEDIFSKMPNETVKAVLVKKEEEMIRKGVFACTDPKLWIKIMPYGYFDSLPSAFVDDWSGVWVSLRDIKGVHSCGQVISYLDPFPNCMSSNGERLEIVKGGFFIYTPPLAVIPIPLREAKQYFENPEKLRERINGILQNKKGQKLLIVYDSYDEMVKIYQDFDRVEPLRFPQKFYIEEYQGNLHISQVPALKVKIPYEMVKNIKIYDYDITFDKEVVKFKIYTKTGRAELIFNHNNESVHALIKYGNLREYGFTLEPHKLYLFSQTRPHLLHDDEEYKWFKALHMMEIVDEIKGFFELWAEVKPSVGQPQVDKDGTVYITIKFDNAKLPEKVYKRFVERLDDLGFYHVNDTQVTDLDEYRHRYSNIALTVKHTKVASTFYDFRYIVVKLQPHQGEENEKAT